MIDFNKLVIQYNKLGFFTIENIFTNSQVQDFYIDSLTLTLGNIYDTAIYDDNMWYDEEGEDDVKANLAKNEFVFTADAVRGAGNGDIELGAQKMYDTMKNLERRVVLW